MRTFDPKTTLMSEVPDDLTPEEATELFGTQFDPTVRSLAMSLRGLGMSEEDYHALLSTSENLTEFCVDHDRIAALTVEEAAGYMMLCDLVTAGLLCHTMFENRAELMPQMKSELLQGFLVEMLREETNGN